MTFECPKCGVVSHHAPIEKAETVRCLSCGSEREVRPDSFGPEGLRKCPLSATEDLYVQKDFPQGLGLAIVIAGFVISTVFWYYDRPFPALGILLVSALADMALFYIVPDVTICYRCLSQYRGLGANPEGRFRYFDLAIGERYRQERIRVEQLRAEAAKTGATPTTGT